MRTKEFQIDLQEESAEKKFWKTPELVEELLDFLDLDSIKQLAKNHGLTKEILGKEVVWQKILKDMPCHLMRVINR